MAQQPIAYALSPVVSALLSLIHPVLCAIIHASYICGACSTRHPSSRCVSYISQALATGAATVTEVSLRLHLEENFLELQ